MTGKQPANSDQAAGGILGPEWDGYTVFTVEEAAKILRLGRTCAYMAAQAGELPTLQFGRRRVVPRLAIEKLLTGPPGQRPAA